MAQDDVWEVNASGNASGSWNTATNWSSNPAIPSGVATADFSQQDISLPSTITLDGNQTIGNITFGNVSGTGAWIINSDSSGPGSTSYSLGLTAPGFNLITVNQGVATINAQMTNGYSGDNELGKSGAGTLVLTANNQSLTGTVAINNGVLELDFSQLWSPTTNILGDDGLGDSGATHLQLQGGTLLVNGASSETNSQSFSAGTATELGDSSIVLNQNGAANLSVNLGALTHNWASALDVTLPTTGTVSMTFGAAGGAYPSETFGTATSTGGLLVDSGGMAFATVNGGADWAAINTVGGNNYIVAGSSVAGFYTPSTTTTLAGNADVVTNVNLPSSTAVSSLRFNSAASTVDLGANTLTTAGILMTPGASGNVVIQNGTLTTSATNELFIDQDSPTKTLTISANISGGVDILKSGAGTMVLSGTNTYTGWNYLNSGTTVLAGGSVGQSPTLGNSGDTYIAQAFGNTATLDVNAGTWNSGRTVIGGNPGNYAGGNGTLNQSGGVINSSYWFSVGLFGPGTYNMTGGVLNTNPGGFGVSNFEISVFSTGSGTVNLSGTGQINIDNNGAINFADAGSSQNGTFNQNGGAVTFYSDGGTTVGGTGGIVLGASGTGVYTYNLNAGTLTVPSISEFSGTGILNLNGGTLRAATSNNGFMGGLSAANVQVGGAIIDTNGNNITVLQPLIHPAALGATLDGGLTKNGAGTLQVGGASTYTGATTINAGTLQLPAPAVPVAVASYSFDSMSPGVLNPGQVITNSGSGGSALNGTVNIADWTGVGSGPASGATVIASGPFASSHSVQFDGAGTSIDIASQIVNQSSGANWTFSAWVQTSTPGATIASKNSGGDTWQGGNTVYYLGATGAGDAWSNDGYPTAVRFGQGFLQGTPPVGESGSDGNWHMITYEDSGGTQAIYLDGQNLNLNLTGAGGPDVSTLTRLGINVDTFFAGDGNSDFFGNMDDINFYDVALSPTQIGELYSSNIVTSIGGGGQYLPLNTPVNITTSGAALDLNNQVQTIGSLAGVAGSSVLLGSGTLTTGGNNTSTTFAGSISGSGGLIKQGTGTMTLDGVNSYTGGTKVADATLVIGANGALAPGNVTIGDGNAVLQLAANTGGESISSLSILSGSFLDVGNNHIVISDPGGSIDATIRGYLANGYNNGNWNGTSGAATGGGIGTSSATGTQYGIGYADGADGGISGITSGQLEVKYTLYGDANLDGSVNSIDFGDLAANFGKSSKVWDQGDFNYDGTVNSVDFGLLAGNFGKSVGGNADVTSADWAALDAFASANGLMADVPEPASASLLAIGAIGLLGRRRRRNQATA
ncbi:MAG TPA: autotransporter-associated beta strand repeat-containing protein [Tepidisphaeraceae bacterium]|nr:autotransporter-associated beta strand repeat-containing protein [Tepidisphaeraceae bacterium]